MADMLYNSLGYLRRPNPSSSTKVENACRAQINGRSEQGTTHHKSVYMMVQVQAILLPVVIRANVFALPISIVPSAIFVSASISRRYVGN